MFIRPPYSDLSGLVSLPDELVLIDHLGGFDHNGVNPVLDALDKKAQDSNTRPTVWYHNVLQDNVTDNYTNLRIGFDADLQNRLNLTAFYQYTTHPALDYKNFICSFNGSPHVSRKLLVSILHRFGWFNPEYISKNFSYSIDAIDGHLSDLTGLDELFYRKFFISDNTAFYHNTYSFGHVRFDHCNNIFNLENKITKSFLHIVSETLATSYCPFVTEKFLYSIVTRGLFLAYAQPGWHDHLEKYYGFKKYTKLFDYGFDSIQNPVERLVNLVSMISKFSILTVDDWKDLYLLEQDSIEYNYNHYFSQNYLKHLKRYT